MFNRDDNRASKETQGHRSKSARSRKAKLSVEGLEERSLMSGAGGRAALIEARQALLAERAAHRLQLRAEILADRQVGFQAPISTTSQPSVVAAARIPRPPGPAASQGLQVQ